MADEHTQRMFTWRSQVGDDHSLSPFDFRVAYALAERTYRNTGCARVSQAVLADDVGATTRGVQKSLCRLAQRRHLQIEDNSKRGLVNRYWPIIRSGPDEEPSDASEGTNGGSYPHEGPYEPPFVPPTNHGSGKVRTTVRTEHLRRTSEGPSETISTGKEASVNEEGAFEVWWSHYPRRVAKATARKAYYRVLAEALATPEELVRGAMRYAAERDGQEEKYTKHPATWLKGECWTDEPTRPHVSAEDRTEADVAVARDVIASLNALSRAELMGETCPPEAVEQAQRALAAVIATERLQEACSPVTFAAARRAIHELPGLIERARQGARQASRFFQPLPTKRRETA